MRTVDDSNKLIELYNNELRRTDISGLYVITADAMTVNKNKTGRYEASKVSLPTTFDEGGAQWRMKTEKKKNTLFNYRVVSYKQWLKIELKKLQSLVEAQTRVQRGYLDEDQIRSACQTGVQSARDDDSEPVADENGQDSAKSEQEKSANKYIIEINILSDSNCPCGCNNCLCCRFADNIRIENYAVKFECLYPRAT